MEKELNQAVSELLANIGQTSPYFKPSILPSALCPLSLDDLFAEDIVQSDKYRKWKDQLDLADKHIFLDFKLDFPRRNIEISSINVVNELDYTLSSPEKVISLLLKGDETQIGIAVARFFELNGYTSELSELESTFREIYNNAYAVRILLSNVPGFKTTVLSNEVPLREISLQKLAKIINKDYSSTFANNINQENDDDEDVASKKTKNKKRKRGGNKNTNHS